MSGKNSKEEPPNNDQVYAIQQIFNNLIGIINKNVQSSNNNNNQKQNQGSNDSTAKSLGIDLKDEVHQLFVEIVKSIRHSKKKGNGDELKQNKSYLIKQFTDLKGNLGNLRMEMINLFNDTIQKNSTKLSDSLIFDYQELIDEVMVQFCEDLYDIYAKMLQYDDREFCKEIFDSLFEGITIFLADLEKFHLEIIQSVDLIVRPENETGDFISNCKEFGQHNSNSDPDDETSKKTTYERQVEKLTEFFNGQIDSTLKYFQSSLNQLHSVVKKIDEFTLNFYKLLVKADPEFSFYSPAFVYEPLVNGLSQIGDFLNQVSHNESEGNGGNEQQVVYIEQLWEDVRREKCIAFVSGEISSFGDILQRDLQLHWRSSTGDVQQEAGQYLFQVFNARFECHDAKLLAKDVAAAFKFAVQSEPNPPPSNDEDDEDDLISDLQSLLEGIFDRSSSDLLTLRNRQIKFLSHPPDGDANAYRRKSKRIAKEIEEKTLEMNSAISDAREANFTRSRFRMLQYEDEKRARLLKKKLGNEDNSDDNEKEEEEDLNEEESGEEEEQIDYVDNFQSYDNEESEAIRKQLDRITSLDNSVFNSMKGKSNVEFNNRPRMLQSQKVPSANEGIVTKSMKVKLQKQMDDDSIMQATCIEEAMVSTYIQLIASTKGILVGLIRTNNYTQAKKVKDEMDQTNQELMGHLESIKKRAKLRNDVQASKAINERIETLQFLDQGSLKKCICDSLRNVIEATIRNYNSSILLCDEKHRKKVGEIRQKAQETVDNVKEQKHIPDLYLIEKKRRIELKREEDRMDMNDYEAEENAINRYIDKKEYKLAEIEKEKLKKKKEQEKQKRLEEVEKKYAELRDQKKKQIEEELRAMDMKFKKRKKFIDNKNKKDKNVQKEILIYSLKASSLEHYQFALKILKVDQKVKREIKNMLNEVVNSSVEKENESVAKLLNERRQKTDWVQ